MSKKDPPVCRLCGDAHVECLGRIPDSDYFAGRVLHTPIAGGYLWSCSGCRSLFRHPVLSSEMYLHLYSAGATEQWQADAHRIDLATIREIIDRRRHTSAVLDVGCGTGGFLLTLPAQIHKSGIEPSAAAAQIAAGQGINILGKTLRDLPAQARFDVITLIDVIEHIADPLAELDEAVAHLSPGGALIISTGDPNNIFWRAVFKARFWYSYFPEHISFPSLQLLEMWRLRHGMQPPLAVDIHYRSLRRWHSWIHGAAQALFSISPWIINRIGRTVAAIQRAPEPRRRYFSAGAPGVFKDHQVIAISSSIHVESDKHSNELSPSTAMPVR